MAKTTQLGHSISRYLSEEKICGVMLMAALQCMTPHDPKEKDKVAHAKWVVKDAQVMSWVLGPRFC